MFERVWIRVNDDNCTDLAAEVSYYFVLSLFPFFLVIAVLVGSFPSPVLWHSFTQWVVSYFPRLSQSLVFSTLLDLHNVYTGALSFGVAATAWSASSGFMSLMSALTTAQGKRDERSYLKRRAIALAATLGAAAFFFTSFSFWTAGRWAVLNFSQSFQQILKWDARWRVSWWTLTAVLIFIGVDLLNYFLPPEPRAWKWVSAGRVFVAFGFALGTAGLNMYARYSSVLPRTYGTFTGFIILMTWIYIATLVLLIGAEIDSALGELQGRHP